MRDKLQKLMSYLMLFVMLFTNPATIILANAAEKTATPSVTVGQLVNEGDIKVTKSVTATDTPGQYKITFEIEGVPVHHSSPLYAAVVFDRSGSMICHPYNPDTSAELRNRNPHFTAADGQGIACTYDNWPYGDAPDWVTPDKWKNAVAGAQSFQSTIKNALGDDAHVSLVTFASNAASATEDFSAASFGHPIGSTDLAGAINNARTYINNASSGEANAKKVILVISDGQPSNAQAATNAANTAKNNQNNIEIYAIGYDTDGSTSDYLRSISSYNPSDPNDKHYSNANPDTVSAAVQEMVNELLAAGTNASIEDTLTTEFSFASDAFTGQSHTFALNNITAEKQTVEFLVDIDQTLESGIYDTNNTTDSKAELTYTNADGEVKHLVFNESPSVEWERPDANYIVNYFFGGVKDDSLTTTSKGELTTEIPYDKNITSHKGYVYNHIEDYNNEEVTSGVVKISQDESKNIVNVYYEKKTGIEYNVYYHYENLDGTYSEEADSNSPFTATYGDVISNNTTKPETDKSFEQTGLKEGFTYDHSTSSTEDSASLTIDDVDSNRLDLYYTRNNYGYCIKYFYDEVEDETLRVSNVTSKFGSTISYTDNPNTGYNKAGYRLDRLNPQSGSITINAVGPNQNAEDVNLIEAYYVKDNINYTVNYYKDSKSDSNKLGETVTKDALFESTVTLTDEDLNKEIIPGYKVQDGQTTILTITANPENNNIDVIYVRDNINYTVNYYKDSKSDSNKLGETVTKDALFESTVTLTDEDLNKEIIPGYKVQDGQTTTLTITANPENNNIDVIYVKKDNIEYNVYYHYENLDGTYSEETDSSNPYTATYLDVITKDTNVNNSTFEQKGLKTGFEYNHSESSTENSATLTIDDVDTNRLDLFYDRGEYNYCIKYFYDEVEDETLRVSNVTSKFGTTISYTDNPNTGYNKAGYRLDRLNPQSGSITINAVGPNQNAEDVNLIEVYYVKDNINYTVNYYKDSKSDSNKLGETVTKDALFESTVTLTDEELNKEILPGYKVQDGQTTTLTITANPEDNNIDVIYVKDNINYTVNYYKDSKTASNKLGETVTKDALFESTVTLTDEELNKEILPGYKVQDGQTTTLTITANPENNNIDVIYVKDNINYTVNYYKDSKSDSNKLGETVTKNALFESTVTLTDEELNKEIIPGYKVQDGQTTTLTITANPENNNIDVIYVKDNINYTVNYYKDSKTDSNKLGETVTKDALFESTVTLTDEELNKEILPGYKVQDGQTTTLTITANPENNNIDVIYIKDEFNYCVKYFYDEVEDTSKEVKDIKALFGETISYEDKNIIGYVFDRTDPKDGSITVTENPESNILKVYYKKGQFDYTVEYYYEGTKDDSKTETKKATYKDVIDSYTDKNIDGYKLDKVENSPLTITENSKNNVIKVYYVKDKFDYVVEYYIDDEIKEEVIDKETFEEDITFDPLTIDGIELIGTDPENGILTISSDPSKNIIRVYYRSVTKEEPIEIPNTMVNGPKDNNSLLYLLIILNIMLSSVYVTRKNN